MLKRTKLIDTKLKDLGKLKLSNSKIIQKIYYYQHMKNCRKNCSFNLIQFRCIDEEVY